MAQKTNNVRVIGALERLKGLPQPVVESVTTPEPAVVAPAPNEPLAQATEPPSAPTTEPLTPASRRPLRPAGDVATKAAMLRTAPTKAPTYMQEKPYAKMGRPTQKQGDLKTDYVKISPAIPRSIKDRLDDALPGLKRDPAAGVLTMEDVVSKALDAYLTARGK